MSISDIHRTDESDLDLIARTRAGDVDAFAILHTRHVGSAQALARRMSRSGADADDLVSEGFARVLSALQRGKGPDLAFRPYLLSTIRRLAYDRTSREQREAPTASDDEPEVALPVGDPVVDGFERDTAAAAFASLPERWRMVLWHTEVEGQSPAMVGELLGMNPNAVAALAYRAREGLRQAYLTEHAPKTSTRKECELTQSRLGPYVRGGLTPARETRLRTHLDECDDCQAAYLELASVNTAMPAIVVFAVLGPVGGGYLASVLGAGAATGTGAAGLAGAGTGAVAAGGGTASGSSTGAATTVGRVAARGRYLAMSTGVAAAVVAVVVTAVLAARRDEPPTPAAAAPVETSGPRTAVEGIATQRPPADPTVADVATTISAPTAAPNTSTPTAPSTTPATTRATMPATRTAAPTTTTTAPAEPSALAVEVSGAGVLVRDRPGVILVSVANDGSGTGTDTSLELTLTGATLRGLPQTPLDTRASGPGGRAADDPTVPDAWWCTTSSPTTLRCTNPSVTAGSTSSLFVPVAITAGTTDVRVHASATATDDLGRPESSPTVDLPVEATGMAARFATVDRGAVATIGNTLLTCNPSAPQCAATLAGGAGALDNGSFAMVPIDVDGDPATSNSSSADLPLTSGADVLSATLYWSADLAGGPGGSPAPGPAARASAVLTGPGGARSSIVAERVDDIVDDERYQAIADVTAQVRAAGAGRWTFGGAQVSTGANTYAGWSLVVVYRDPALPPRSLVVLDGFAAVNASSTVSFTVGGFVVPAGGATGAVLDVVTYEGDLGLVGDQLSMNGVALTDAANPLGNSFNSSASDRGSPMPGRTPSWRNLLGIDLDRFDVGRVLASGSTSTTITFSTNADRYLTGAVAIAIDQ